MKQQTDPKQGALKRCYHLSSPDRIQIAFDDHRLVANAGLLLPVTLAQRLGLSQLVQECLDLGNAPGPGQSWRQDDDPGGVGAGWWRLH